MTGARPWFAVLAAGSAAFTLLGSLVPFEFQPRPVGEAAGEFARLMVARLWPVSKSDAVANVFLGVPLGFALLGLLCNGERVSRPRAILLGLAVLPVCAAFAAAVEFAQLYTPGRTCAGSDVVAQTIGSALGVVVWLTCGPRLTDEARKAATGAEPAARLLVGYSLLLAFLQALPLDVSPSPADAYRKFRDGGVNPVPFREFASLGGNSLLGRTATLLTLAGLYLPVGLLAARLPGRWASFPRVLALGVGLAVLLELGQIFVKSRSSSATDVVVGTAAVALGWAVSRELRRRMTAAEAIALAAVWWAAVCGVSWQPFETGAAPPFDWVPGMPLEGANPFRALEAMLTKVVLFGLGGAIWAGRATGTKLSAAAALGLLAAAVVEAGQTHFAGHTPCVTDVLLGGLGAFCGAWVSLRVRANGQA